MTLAADPVPVDPGGDERLGVGLRGVRDRDRSFAGGGIDMVVFGLPGLFGVAWRRRRVGGAVTVTVTVGVVDRRAVELPVSLPGPALPQALEQGGGGSHAALAAVVAAGRHGIPSVGGSALTRLTSRAARVASPMADRIAAGVPEQ